MAMDCSLGPCFFKVFLPELSSQHLTIPPAFRRHLELEARSHGQVSVSVSLTGPSGNTWCVDLATDSKGGLCFHKGWREFVTDHSIKLGDFLVFRYDRSFRFTVWLFDTTACQKKSAFSASPHREEIIISDESDGGATPMRKRKSDGDPALQGPPKRNCPTRAARNSSTRAHVSSPRRPQKGNDAAADVTKSKCNPCTKKARGRPRKTKNMAKQWGKTPSPSTVSTAREVSLSVKSETMEEFSVTGKLTKKSDCSAKPQPSVNQARDRRCSPRRTRKEHFPYEEITIQRSRLEPLGCDTTVTKSKSNPCTGKARGRPKLGVAAMLQKIKNMAKQRGEIPSPSSASEACEVALGVKSETTEEFFVPGIFTKKDVCSAKSKPRNKQDKFEGRRIGSLLSRRRPVTDQEVKKALDMALSFKSKNPFITVIMQAAYVYVSFFLHIPRRFAVEHVSLDSRKMTLWGPDGKPWPVNYSIVKNCGRIYGGWYRFSYAHNLELDDVCVFELIEKNQFKVHIFRVVEKVTPYIRITKAMCELMSKS